MPEELKIQEAFGILIYYKDDDQKDLVHEQLRQLAYKQIKLKNRLDSLIAMRRDGVVLYFFQENAVDFVFPEGDSDPEMIEELKKGAIFVVEKETSTYVTEENKDLFRDMKQNLGYEKIGAQVSNYIFQKLPMIKRSFPQVTQAMIDKLA